MDGDNQSHGSENISSLTRDINVENVATQSGDATDNLTAEEEESYDEPSSMSSDKKVLDEEKQGILFEILKCAVCLEIPKGKQNLQVRTCEKGHHFCSPCHKKLRKCAICRGRLFIGRNFVVEELITKLGPNLGIAKCKIPYPELPPKLSAGMFLCLHQCRANLPAGSMLPHIRSEHKQNLVDNVRSNPFKGNFDWLFNISLTPDMAYTLSAQVSDMGLFTIVISFKEKDLIGYVQVLGDDNIAKLFKYQLTARIMNESNGSNFFTAFDCNVSSYSTNPDIIIQSGQVLKIKGANFQGLIKEKDTLQIWVSIWRANIKKVEKDFNLQILTPEVPIVFRNDRKTRRNRNRNERKKKSKEKIRSVKKPRNEELVKKMSALRIVKTDS